MFSIVPDKALESSLCASCGKYLSVFPVTISEGKISCGRCVDVKGGTQSSFNKVTQDMLFKCVNRYEGCSKLLTPNQVLEHEEMCKSNKYECPLCAKKVPSYVMIQHFREYHTESLIKTPEFKLNTAIDTFKTFLYYTDKHIFFIHVSLDVDSKLSLKATCLGPSERSKNIKYNFNLSKGEHFRTPLRCFKDNAQEICLEDGTPFVRCELIVNYDAETSLDFFTAEPRLRLDENFKKMYRALKSPVKNISPSESDGDRSTPKNKLNPPKFDGKSKWETFRQEFEKAVLANGWTYAEKARELVKALHGDAAKLLLRMSVPERLNYGQLLRDLEMEFGQTQPGHVYRNQLKSCVQRPDESLQDFSRSVVRLVRAGWSPAPKQIIQTLAVDAFIHGLRNKGTKKALLQNRPRQLDAALTRALELEMAKL